jgi:uncharacterized protein with PIN domain
MTICMNCEKPVEEPTSENFCSEDCYYEFNDYARCKDCGNWFPLHDLDDNYLCENCESIYEYDGEHDEDIIESDDEEKIK